MELKTKVYHMIIPKVNHFKDDGSFEQVDNKKIAPKHSKLSETAEQKLKILLDTGNNLDVFFCVLPPVVDGASGKYKYHQYVQIVYNARLDKEFIDELAQKLREQSQNSEVTFEHHAINQPMTENEKIDIYRIFGITYYLE